MDITLVYDNAGSMPTAIKVLRLSSHVLVRGENDAPSPEQREALGHSQQY